MSCAPFVLAGEFPGDVRRILELESDSERFMDLAEAYEAVSAELLELETCIEPVCQAYRTQLHRQREQIKQQLFALLNA